MLRWTALVCAALAASCARRPQQSESHPLDPLSASEISIAVATLRSSGHLTKGVVMPIVALHEPAKTDILAGRRPPREAFAVVLDSAANRTSEAVVDVHRQALVSWKEVPGAQAPLTGTDAGTADRILRADPRWRTALSRRGLSPSDVVIAGWTSGYFARTHEDGSRLLTALTFERSRNQDFFTRPVEGIFAEVDLTHQRVLAFTDAGPLPRSADTPAVRPRDPPRSLSITQPDGVSFTVAGHEIRWQKWRFRWGIDPREGLVLYTVAYEDAGRVRPILYRASVSEMLVPYGDPDPAWFFRSTFDVGELGIGRTVSPMRRGIDCPDNAQLFPAVLTDDDGAPNTIANAVAVYERDGGLAWKHGTNARRARELVIGFLTEAGNYDYGFDWIFRQDGSLEARVTMTGIMAVKGVPDGAPDHHGHVVARNLSAVHHQHFFNYRLDFDVDGTGNRLIEMNTETDPGSKYGTAFHMTESVLRSEAEAQRTIDTAASRRWKIVNPKVASAYILLPGDNAFPFSGPASWVRRRAGFINAHLWATPYDGAQRYAAGEYPNQSRATDGLPVWTRANRSLDEQDLVIWYTLGITHLPRPEEWPIMPVHTAGFRLVPAGFFERNPALDLP